MFQRDRIRPRPTLPVLVLLLLGGCRNEKVAENTLFVPEISPQAIVELPEEIEEATIDVADGRFRVSDLILQEDEPTVLHVANADDEQYRLRIVEDLVTPTALAADATTDVEFTTPTAGVFEAQLLAMEGDRVLDTLQVVVLAPGAVEPS